MNRLLARIFSERRKAERLDWEAIEMAVRSALHQAGAAALSELLQWEPPPADQRSVPCPCGQQAPYHELRSKPFLTAVGPATISRPYYLCPHCHAGQFPVDVELDIENSEFSPGVRRMLATVGQQAPFDQGRQQMKLLADLEVTTKAVERIAEAIGQDIAACEQEEIERALQLDLPILVGEPVPILYVLLDGTGVPVVKKETEGRSGKHEENQPTPGRSSWDAYLRRPKPMPKAILSAIRIPPPIRAPSRPPSSSANASIGKLGNGAGAAPKRRWSWVMDQSGSGIRLNGISPVRRRSSTCITRANLSGSWLGSCTPMMRPSRTGG